MGSKGPPCHPLGETTGWISPTSGGQNAEAESNRQAYRASPGPTATDQRRADSVTSRLRSARVRA